MEIDNLKTIWKRQPSVEISQDDLLKKLTLLLRPAQKMRKAYYREAALIVMIFSLFIAIVALCRGQISPFFYKLIAIVFFGISPIIYRFFQLDKSINNIDFSQDIRSNVVWFLAYFRKTLRWYWRCSLVISVFSIIVLFTDKDFLGLPLPWRMGTMAYMGLILFLTKPYLNKNYESKIKEMEDFLE